MDVCVGLFAKLVPSFSPQVLTAQAKNSLQEASAKFAFEQFTENELLVNITDHVLVPKHEVRERKGGVSNTSRTHCNPNPNP